MQVAPSASNKSEGGPRHGFGRLSPRCFIRTPFHAAQAQLEPASLTFAASTCAWPWMLGGLDGLAATGRPRLPALTALARRHLDRESPQFMGTSYRVAFLFALLRRCSHGRDCARRDPDRDRARRSSLAAGARAERAGPRGRRRPLSFRASDCDSVVWTGDAPVRAGAAGGVSRPMNYWSCRATSAAPMALLLASAR